MSALSPPGPPPSMPPPPTPTSLASSSHDSLRVSTRTPTRDHSRDLPHPVPARPRLRPSHAAPQWPARPQSQVITDAAVWPVKAPRKAPPPPPPPAPAAADAPTRRSTSSTRRSLSSRLSLHRAHPTQHDAPPLPARRSSPSRIPGQGPALQKKRSFFRRIADRLTRSRTSLHSSPRSSVVDDVRAAPRRSATVPNKALAPISTDRSAEPASTLPTPTSTHTKSRRRPASIEIYASDGSSPGLLTPSGVPLPPSPRPETIGTPTSSTQPSVRPPPSPATSSRHPPSPTTAPLPPPSPGAARQPASPSPRQPLAPRVTQQTVPASPRPSLFAEAAGRATPASPSPSPVSLRAKPELYFPLPPHAPPVKRRDTRGPRADEERERPALVSDVPPARRLSDTAEEDEDEDDEEEERRASEIKVNRWLATPESPTTSSSLDHSLSQSHSQSSHSHSGGSRGVVSGKRFGSSFGGIDEEGVGLEMWRGAVMADDDVDNVLPEVERMALEAEERVRARGVGLAVGKKAGGDPREGSLTKVGRQISLFGRRRGKEGDGVKAPTLRPRAATFADPVSTSTRRRSFGFLSPLPASPTSSLPPLPTSPSLAPTSPTSTCPSDAHVPAARPRPRRQGVSPTMHTRGSILLEANDIQDPEVRRLSEMVFLT